MIQDIFPSRLDNHFEEHVLSDQDTLLIFDAKGKVYVGEKDGQMVFPSGKDLHGRRAIYLFSIDERRYFLLLDNAAQSGDAGRETSRQGEPQLEEYPQVDVPEGFRPYSTREVRDAFAGKEVFAVFTGYHLWKWYDDNRFCGKCAKPLEPHHKERALRCPECGNVIYPRINPAVIVGVTRGDSMLITRYRTGYAHNALVAGFTEIGETLEECVAREVMEETGVRVKNVRYYKSQPWGMAQDILMGFFCDADGDGEICMDEGELKYAEWVPRKEIVLQPNSLSLTNEMMRVFKNGEL